MYNRRYKKTKYTPSAFRLFYTLLSFIVAGLLLYAVYLLFESIQPRKISQEALNSMSAQSVSIELPSETSEEVVYPSGVESAKQFDKTIKSKYCILVDNDNNTVIAQRNADKKMYPASMTKIMTLIVAVENMHSLDDTFTMTADILAPLYEADASLAGFADKEVVTVRDMLYGAILPSGADATVGLAEKIAGSEEKFVELMNEKAEQLGLKNTHFCNTSGLHDPEHYTTVLDMAVILSYALKDDICREILSTYQYTTAKTKEHPDGIWLESTLFSRMYGDEVEGVRIKGGKTGYTDEAEHTTASFAEKNGKEYICVIGYINDKWGSVYDTFDIYEKYIPSA